MRSKFLCSVLLLSSIAIAQTQPPPPASSVLSELERTKLELASTKLKLANTQMSIVQEQGTAAQKEMQQLIITIETAHPGYMISQQTGELVPKAAPISPAPVKTTPKTK